MTMAQPQTTQLLLHGVIEARILEADLSVTRASQLQPSKEIRMKRKAFKCIRRLTACTNICRCQRRLKRKDGIGLGTDDKLYATVDIDMARVGRTRLVPVHSPKWDESFHIYCAHDASNIIFTVKVDNAIEAVTDATLIGRAYMPTEGVVAGQEVDLWLPIRDENQQPLEGGDQIRVQLQFTDVTADRTAGWGTGVGSAAYSGVPYTFFKQRRGCRVRLYEDAHVAGDFAPRIRLADGRFYEPQKCWVDVFDAINRARRMVYIAGWSVNTDVVLVRDPSSASPSENLGQLLIRKAAEGVTVLMLVWDDRMSMLMFPIRHDGRKATSAARPGHGELLPHGQDTASYFPGTRVQCVPCPRNPDMERSYDIKTGTMFTHHQKTVIVDGGGEDGPESPPGLVSFLGGIDLCDGRYDTQDHPLFRTLGTTHNKDFHQPNFFGASISKGGPREPWHDIHCRVEGPAAWDVLENFEQRWRKQGKGDKLLVALNKAWAEREAAPQGDTESWNVQVFRSIDGGAAAGFPDDPLEAAALGLLVSGKEHVIERSGFQGFQGTYYMPATRRRARGRVSGKDHVMERSIQDAYIHAIRRARDFIYIENQYFLGSSYAWRDINALNLIPKELSLKIVSKIQAGERFAVYVVLPLWPEGVPESDSVQAILRWQRRTMEMMYRDVTLAIRAKGLQADPRDYLTFFCLGNREAPSPGEYVPPEHPYRYTNYARAQQARRFMIYVHSKTMIVDDEYIIVGSANINQRSMDGGRDTEIAMGAYQPGYLATGKSPARGQVHGFRVALWQEHLGQSAAAAVDLLSPSSLACVRWMNQVAKQHWDMFASDTFQGDLPGHLMEYPVSVLDDGKVVALPENRTSFLWGDAFP